MDIYLSRAEPEYNYRLIALLRSRHPLLFVSTTEEHRFIDHLRYLAIDSDYLAYRWDCVHGLRCFNPNLSHDIDADQRLYSDPVETLRHIIEKIKKIKGNQLKRARGAVFVLCDFYKYLGSRHDPKIERLLSELANEHRGSTVIVTGPKYLNSDSLGHLFENLHFPRPNRKEISSELDKIVSSSTVQQEYPYLLPFVKDNRDALIDSVLGLTMSEIRSAYTQTIVSSGDLGHHPLELSVLIAAKRSAISKNHSLGYVETTVKLEDIGGLDPLINWIKDRKLAFSPEAKRFGIDEPRGVLLCGVPGMGKSLSAKGMAQYFGRPLLRLDLGAIMDSLVGESEANIREAIALAETLAPCVTGDTRVFDANGYSYTIEDIMNNESLFSSDSFYTYSFNEKTLMIEKTRVDAIVKKPRKRETIEIVTANSSVRVTVDHQMMVIRNGKLKWVKASRIVPNDFIVSPKKLKRDPIKFELKNIFDETFDIDNNGIRSKTEENRSEDVLFSENGFDIDSAAYITGMIDGLGSLDNDGVISFEGINPFTNNLFSSRAYSFCVAMQSCFGIEPDISSGKDNYTTCYVYNEIVYRIIDYIRENLISFDDSAVGSYISGFIESSANIQTGPNSKISFIVEDTKERERLCNALNCIGIVSPKRTMRSVFISSQHEIDTLARVVVNKIKIGHLREQITQSVGDCNRLSNHIGYHLGGVEIAAEESKNNIDVATLASSDIIGVRVLSVNPSGKEIVYDLSCEGNHNFFANNLLCHNCVLWVDEVEKALSAAVGKGSGDSGTTKRVISTFLTWMQEKKKSVFVVCTANNMEDIPPEFMRAGRLDETFFIDLPDASEREDIIRIMLRLKGYDADSIAEDDISAREVAEHPNLECFSGAEIEKAVNEAMFFAFKEDRDLRFDDIIRSAGQFKPLAKMRSAEISAMREWAQENARFANTHKIVE